MNRRVLYVDDEPDNLYVFEAGFEDDFDVETATSGPEALELMERHEFPVVIADQRMPGMTGVQFLEILREQFPLTKRILLTGYSDPDAMVDAMNKGRVFHYVRKPWERPVLYSVLVRAFETYELERANTELTNRLVEDDRCATLGRMTASITHEIGNQLCLLPLLEAMEEKYADNEDFVEFGRVTRQVLERLTALVDEVKRFTRFEHEQFAQHVLPLRAVALELLSFLRFDQRIPVDRIETDFDGNPVVLGNKLKLQQVLVNLLRNAVDAIEGRDDGRIVVQIREEDDEAVLAVQDNGCGMPPDVQVRIWEPFFSTKGQEGNGIGLDVSRRIVEAHRGRLVCHSEPENGATFELRLPRQAPNANQSAPPETAGDDERAWTGETQLAGAFPAHSGT